MKHNMILRESIKDKVDKLDKRDLRIVELLIDSLKRNNPAITKRTMHSKNYPYQQVIEIMGKHAITYEDINLGREDRL